MEFSSLDVQPHKRVRTAEPPPPPQCPSMMTAASLRSGLIENYYRQFPEDDEEFSIPNVDTFSLLQTQFDELVNPIPDPVASAPASGTDSVNSIPEMKFNRDSGYEAGRLISLTMRLKTEPIELQLFPANDPEKAVLKLHAWVESPKGKNHVAEFEIVSPLSRQADGTYTVQLKFRKAPRSYSKAAGSFMLLQAQVSWQAQPLAQRAIVVPFKRNMRTKPPLVHATSAPTLSCAATPDASASASPCAPSVASPSQRSSNITLSPLAASVAIRTAPESPITFQVTEIIPTYIDTKKLRTAQFPALIRGCFPSDNGTLKPRVLFAFTEAVEIPLSAQEQICARKVYIPDDQRVATDMAGVVQTLAISYFSFTVRVSVSGPITSLQSPPECYGSVDFTYERDDAELVKALLDVPPGSGGPRTPDNQRTGGSGRGRAPGSGNSNSSPGSPSFFSRGPAGSPGGRSPAESLVLSAPEHTNEDLYISLLRSGSFPRDRVDSHGRTLLHYCCLFGFANLTARVLRCRWNVNLVDRYGCTPLHLAAYRGDMEIAQMLLRHGASLSARDDCGDTPAAIALRVREFELCRELLMHEYARRRVGALIGTRVVEKLRTNVPSSPTPSVPMEVLEMINKDIQLTFSSEAAVKIQSLFRRYQARKYFLALRRSAVKIQNMYRIHRIVIKHN